MTVTSITSPITLPVYSVNEDGQPPYTSIEGPGKLAAPVLSVGTPASTSIPLSWTYTDDGQTGFEIQRSVDNTTWTTITTTSNIARSYTASGLTAETLYYFRIRAVDSGDAGRNSNWSGVVSATTSVAPPAPVLEIPAGAKVVSAPTFSFDDDFEGAMDTSFWGGTDRGSMWRDYGETDPNDPGNKVLRLRYEAKPDPVSQQDFHLPQVQEASFLYRLYTPPNYEAGGSNHKVLVLWSDTYGKFNPGVHISSEAWPVPGGKTPSMYIGVGSGDNKGHTTRNEANRGLIYEAGQGGWSVIYVYVKVAPGPGQYGEFELWRDGVKLISTDDTDAVLSGQSSFRPASELINWTSVSNYLEYGYLPGAWNQGAPGPSTQVNFLIDNISVRAK